jgi:hypothetical protein
MLPRLVSFGTKNLPSLLNHFDFHSVVEVSKMKSTIYLQDYLGSNGLRATHQMTEDEYVNRDFLLDYSEFYSKCFTERYKRKCCRIHFFRIAEPDGDSHTSWTNAILNPKKNTSFWSEAYLGFVVVKPIPHSLIGYSILKHFNYFKDQTPYCKNREFWAINGCKINLFGADIEIQSLPFIQQDSVLAACASVSIWTVFQKASESSFVIKKSPGQITKDAADVNSDGGRLIPNDGLDIHDMCAAITKNGLDTVVYNTKSPSILDSETVLDLSLKARKKGKRQREIENLEFSTLIKKIVYAYSGLENPVILGLSVPRGERRAEHAVAIGGYNLNETTGMSMWKAERIDKLYVHDDQLGPFSKIRFKSSGQLITAWDVFQYAEAKELSYDLRAKIPANFDCTDPLALIVPVFPKVRLSYNAVEDIVIVLNDILKLRFGDQLPGFWEWEIKVKHSKKFKQELKDSGLFDLSNLEDFDQLTNVLSQSMPRYVWNAVGRLEGKRIFDLVFDATDFSNGILCESFFCYSPELFDSLKLGIESDFHGIIKDYSPKNKPFREDYLRFFCENSLKDM